MIPIGQMFEEACNKDMKRFQEHHTRKTSLQHHDRLIEQSIYIFGPSYFKRKEVIPKTQNFPLE
jgi:hypothetical protein